MFDVFSAIGNAVTDIGQATGLNRAFGLLYTKGLSGQRQELLKLLVAAVRDPRGAGNVKGRGVIGGFWTLPGTLLLARAHNR